MQVVETGKLVGMRVLVGCDAAWRRLPSGTRGQSTVEYALIGALIVVIASVAVGLLGGQVKDVFEQMTNALKIGGSAK
jgi:Flp pilus assembly pilin Flp